MPNTPTFEKRLERHQTATYVAALTLGASLELVIPDIGTYLESAIYQVLGVLSLRQRANAAGSPRTDDPAPYAFCNTSGEILSLACRYGTLLKQYRHLGTYVYRRGRAPLLCALAIRPVEGAR